MPDLSLGWLITYPLLIFLMLLNENGFLNRIWATCFASAAGFVASYAFMIGPVLPAPNYGGNQFAQAADFASVMFSCMIPPITLGTVVGMLPVCRMGFKEAVLRAIIVATWCGILWLFIVWEFYIDYGCLPSELMQRYRN